MKKFWFVILAVVGIMFTSCRKPYDSPEFATIGTNDYAFVIDLYESKDVDNSKQVVVNSEEYWNKNMVSAKKFQIPHKWNQTARMSWIGEWLPMKKVITVSSAPSTGTWSNEIKVETSGSQGITVPMKYTIRVTNASKFLSKFSANYHDEKNNVDLASVSDFASKQFKDYVAGVMSEEFHKYSYEEVNKNRDKIVSDAKVRVSEWVKNYGIEIDNLAVFDGLIFDDNNLQNEINAQAAVAAQTKTAEMQKALLEIERTNKEFEANTSVRVTNITASTYKIEQDKLDREQARKNTQIIAEAQARALESGKYAPVPNTLIVQDLKSLGNWNPDFMNGN